MNLVQLSKKLMHEQTKKNKAPAWLLTELAIKKGMTTMFEDGLKKIVQGITTIEEVVRVTKD